MSEVHDSAEEVERRTRIPASWRELPSNERIEICAAAFLLLLIRAVAYVHYRFDSDEPQHLHVAWGWTAGLVQYRDLFDNHAPLFHLLTAPLLRLAGERADVLLFMRAAMLPLFAIALFGTFTIARRLYTFRTAVGATLLLASYPPFFLKSLEFRTDNLWNALWIVTLVVLTGGPPTLSGGPPTLSRLFCVGLLLGCATCVSLKTTLLIVTLAFTSLICVAAIDLRAREVSRGQLIARLARSALATAAGLALLPALLAACFLDLGAWRQAVYCTVTFNQLVTQTRPHVLGLRALYPFLMMAAIAAAWRWAPWREPAVTSRLRFFFAVAAAVFLSTLCSFWVLISTRDFLPLMPIAAIFAAAALVRTARARACGSVRAFTVATLLLCGMTFFSGNLANNQTRESITMIRQVLGLTRRGEPLLDFKGETIYRRRPFYYILEAITRAEMKKGVLRDTIAEDVLASHCFVAQADGAFYPPRGGDFLRANFIDVGRLRAAGKWLPNEHFDVRVPGPYVIIGTSGEADGLLDGVPNRGARQLTTGPHTFLRARSDVQPIRLVGIAAVAAPQERIALLWAPAFTRGYSPFHLRDRDF